MTAYLILAQIRSVSYLALMVLACAFGLTPVAAAAPPEGALGWLAAMHDARKNLDFHGTAALLRDNQVHMVAVAHRVADGLARESMHSLDDPNHKAERSVYFLPNAQRKSSQLLGIGALPEDLADYQRFYRFSLGAREHLIGRLAQEVLIDPLDAYRYGRRFWIDIDNKLPLKYQVLNDGKVLEQLVFSELILDRRSKTPLMREQVAASPHVQAMPLESLQWRLERVPPGYRLVSYVRHSAPSKKLLEHLLLSDGLSALSLYIEENGNLSHSKKQIQHFGVIHIYLRPVGAYQVTVMGEAPMAAVSLVGDAVRRVGQP